MKIVAVLLLLVAMGAIVANVLLLSSQAKQQDYFTAHKALQRFVTKLNNEGLKTAFDQEETAAKEMYLNRDLAKKCAWAAVGLSGLALILTIVRPGTKPAAS